MAAVKLFFDLETYSPVPIAHGLYAYAEKAEVLLTAWAVDDGPVQVAEGVPDEFRRALATASEVWAHNAQFDRTILLATGVAEAEDLSRWRCTRARALVHSLPGALADLCRFFDLPVEDTKQAEDGKKLIRLFCVPQKGGRRVFPADRPDEWQRFRRYAEFDVRALRAVEAKLPSRNYAGRELEAWHADQRINARGVAVDLDLARAAVDAARALRAEYDARAAALAPGALASIRQRDRLLQTLAEQYGVVLPDLRSTTVAAALDGDLPDAARELLLARAEGALAASRKYDAVLAAASHDGRLRGLLQYCGASRTGRWSGQIVQPQNLPRPPAYLKGEAFDHAVEVVKHGAVAEVYPRPMEVLSGVARGVFVAPPGRRLVIADYSAIEARVLAWLAGEQRVLDTFRAGKDVYVAAYAASFGVPEAEVTPEQRQIGKMQVLLLGYGGGVGAVVRAGGAKARAWPDEYIRDQIIQPWRAAHTNIVRLWRGLEAAAKAATERDGFSARVGRLVVGRRGDVLMIRLPSGRVLCYHRPELDRDGQVTYLGTTPFTGSKLVRVTTYGGMLAENVTQAVARDVMRDGMLNAEAAGYEVVLTVHDEIVAEVPDGDADPVPGLVRAMTEGIEWADGLPLAAAGFATTRYRKGD